MQVSRNVYILYVWLCTVGAESGSLHLSPLQVDSAAQCLCLRRALFQDVHLQSLEQRVHQGQVRRVEAVLLRQAQHRARDDLQSVHVKFSQGSATHLHLERPAILDIHQQTHPVRRQALLDLVQRHLVYLPSATQRSAKTSAHPLPRRLGRLLRALHLVARGVLDIALAQQTRLEPRVHHLPHERL